MGTTLLPEEGLVVGDAWCPAVSGHIPRSFVPASYPFHHLPVAGHRRRIRNTRVMYKNAHNSWILRKEESNRFVPDNAIEGLVEIV